MAIERNHRFPIDFGTAFPRGLVLVGDITAKTEYRPDRSKVARQEVDEQTGLLVWAANVTDPDEARAKKASFAVLLLAPVQPVPATPEVLPGMRQVEFEGLTVTPTITGQGEFKSLGYRFYATGIKGDTNAVRPSVEGPAPKRGNGTDASKAA